MILDFIIQAMLPLINLYNKLPDIALPGWYTNLYNTIAGIIAAWGFLVPIQAIVLLIEGAITFEFGLMTVFVVFKTVKVLRGSG